MNYYRRWIGSYKKKTAELSLVEHGVYTLLLDHYYATEKPLAAEASRLSRICGAITPEEQRAVQHVADKFFPVATDGLRHNERADEELGIAQATIEKQRSGGIETAEKRWGKDRSTDAEQERSTKAAAHKSTKKSKPKSTDKSSNGAGVRSTDRARIQPTTNNLQPTAVNHHPTSDNRQGEKPSQVSPAAPSASASPPVSDSNGDEKPERLARSSFASDGEIPWWHSPAGIQRQAIEVDVRLEAGEDYADFKARVLAASGPGPWDLEQPPEVFERIESFRASGGFA